VIEIVKQRIVPASPERLWPFINDVDQLSKWFTFAEKIELLEGSGKGRRQRLHGRWGRKRSEIDQLVVAYRPNEELAWEHEAERLDGRPAPVFAKSTRFSIRLVTHGDDGSIVELRSQQVPAGRLRGAVISLFGKREVAQHMERSLNELASMVASKQP
jgi:uncharacterized protein YndB with AHSA1/START domain